MTKTSFTSTPGISQAGSAPAYLHALAEFACRTHVSDVPARAVGHARWIIADCVPVIGAGMQSAEMQALAARHLAHAASGAAWVIGARRRAAPLDAALLNGTAGTWLDLDEGNTYAKGHPGIQVVPAALAVAQQLGLTGEALLTAVTLGYEVSWPRATARWPRARQCATYTLDTAATWVKWPRGSCSAGFAGSVTGWRRPSARYSPSTSTATRSSPISAVNGWWPTVISSCTRRRARYRLRSMRWRT
ncbi:MAG: MmgE/PrpD family protein [Betaproteobacteria bacterium]|nr:MmgE/PrpD family protein [Betaproteobacteria bacterium]